jgi:putative aldouronate transport system permease protein
VLLSYVFITYTEGAVEHNQLVERSIMDTSGYDPTSYCRMNPRTKASKTLRHMGRQWQLYLFLLLPIAFVITFNYIPMYGVTLAFRDYRIKAGILGSPWAGMKYFNQFFSSPNFGLTLKNTIILSLYSLVAGFPMPIILALCLNEVSKQWFKKTVQMVTYAPFFISTVVLVGMLIQILSPRTGLINKVVVALGGTAVDFMAVPSLFRSIYVWSGIWQGMGYSAIIYIAALSNADPSLYEAAIIDGANRWQKIIHIDFPTILPTMTLLLIMSLGNIMSVGAEKVYLMQNNLNMLTSETISTYVYKIGLLSGQFSLSTAVGVFNSVVNFVLIVLVNKVAQKVGETSLW